MNHLKRQSVAALALSIIMIIVPGSAFSQTLSIAAQIAALKEEVARLSGEVKSLSDDLQTITDSHYELYGKVLDLERADSSVDLDPARPNEFQRLRSSAGLLLVSLEEVTPYLDGYKLRVSIGNPSFATYGGFKVKARWGPRADPGPFNLAKFRERQAQIKEKEISFTERLEPGLWNEVELILTPATATQVGFIQISIDSNYVSLRKSP